MKNITANILNTVTTENISRAKAAFALGLMQIVLIDDVHHRFEDLCGDMYNPQANPEIDPAQLKREKNAFRSRVNRVGVYGAQLQCRATPTAEWVDVNSIWGFVGMDFVGSGYDSEFVEEANEWIFANADLPAMQTAFKDLI